MSPCCGARCWHCDEWRDLETEQTGPIEARRKTTQMAQLIEGQFHGKAIKGTAKVGARKGKPIVVAELECTEGEHKGKRFNYEGKLDDKGIKYTKRDLMALGWKGEKSATITADVDAALAGGLVVPFEVEIAEWNKDDGTTKRWSTIRSIGRFQPKLDDLDKDQASRVDEWFKDAGDVGAPANGVNGTAEDDPIPF